MPEGVPRLFTHRDVTPGNVVFRAGRAWGFIDFDMCAWTTRPDDLANTAMHWVPMCDPVDRSASFADVCVPTRLRLLLDNYGRDLITATALLDACALRFAGSYRTMKWYAENVGGGWARMWDEGVGDVIQRRVAWFDSVRAELAAALV